MIIWLIEKSNKIDRTFVFHLYWNNYNKKQSMIDRPVRIRRWNTCQNVFLYSSLLDSPFTQDIIERQRFVPTLFESLLFIKIWFVSLFGPEIVLKQLIFDREWRISSNRWKFHSFWTSWFLIWRNPFRYFFVSVFMKDIIVPCSWILEGVSHWAIKVIRVFSFTDVTTKLRSICLNLYLIVLTSRRKILFFLKMGNLIKDGFSFWSRN